MSQMIIDFDEEMNDMMESLKKKWNISKNRVVKGIVRQYQNTNLKGGQENE